LGRLGREGFGNRRRSSTVELNDILLTFCGGQQEKGYDTHE
jgi:hypothetical protein